jgi:hypothetical protein
MVTAIDALRSNRREDRVMPAITDKNGETLALLFAAWRRDIASVPVPELVDVRTALGLIRQARAGAEAEVPRQRRPEDTGGGRHRDSTASSQVD